MKLKQHTPIQTVSGNNDDVPTLTVKLKQHTPILHFQPTLASIGATLRATELKSKLDKYLLANNEIKPEWKIGDINALDYKLKVIMCGENQQLKTTGKIPMFFGDNKKPVKVSNRKDDPDITIEIFCLIDELRQRISSVDWNRFLFVNNIGTRQSKGYGSFSLLNTQNLPSVGDMIKAENDISYRVDSFFTLDVSSWNDVMLHISDVYKCFRSGINENGLYFKSLMFAYAKIRGQWWDKRTIKEILEPNKLEEHRRKNCNRTDPDPLAMKPKIEKKRDYYPMFRDNLGLSTEEQWPDYEFREIKRDGGDIKRFKSPLLFKPVFVLDSWRVYILHREIPKKFRENIFTVNKKIRFKTFDNFSIKDYLNYILADIKDYNRYVYVKNDGAEKRKERLIQDLENIKKNYKKIID